MADSFVSCFLLHKLKQAQSLDQVIQTQKFVLCFELAQLALKRHYLPVPGTLQ